MKQKNNQAEMIAAENSTEQLTAHEEEKETENMELVPKIEIMEPTEPFYVKLKPIIKHRRGVIKWR